jgi:putative FmdB family regulatory protein
MPFYEYECENCKFYTELLQKVTDAPLKKCPSCGKNRMKKLVSAPVFRLKGDGWYETDFKGDKENKRNLAIDKEPEAPSEGTPAKSDAKADAKPAADSKPAAEVKPAAVKRPAKSRAKPRPVVKSAARSKAKKSARR